MEEIGLHIDFLERKQNYRGESLAEKTYCIVKVTEEGNGHNVVEEWVFSSWEELKEECPTFKDLLAMFFESEHWDAAMHGGNRILYAEEIKGHIGLYDDYEDTLSYDDIE